MELCEIFAIVLGNVVMSQCVIEMSPGSVQFFSKSRSLCSQTIFVLNGFVEVNDNCVQFFSQQNKIGRHFFIIKLQRLNIPWSKSCGVT